MKNLLYSVLALSVSLTACKYEEGPGVSLRSKRDRVSNEWIVKEYKYKAKDSAERNLTNLFTNVQVKPDPLRSGAFGTAPSTISYVMVIMRTGAYTMGVVDSSKKSIDPSKMWYYVDNNQPTQVDPLGIHSIGRHGEWSFQTKHDRLQFNPDNGGANYIADDKNIDGRLVPVRFDIIMLSNDQLKLEAVDANGGTHFYELEPLNTENYLGFKKQ